MRLSKLFRREAPEATVEADAPADSEGLQRGVATVAAGGTLQSRLQGTAGLLLIGGLGVSLLAWYYSNAFSRVDATRTAAKQSTSARADADAPLPPLGPIEASKPPTQPDSPSPYRIGSVLGDPASPDPAGPPGTIEPTALPPPSPPGPPQKTPQQLLQERLLDGAVFTRPVSAEAIAQTLPGADMSNSENVPTSAQTPRAASALTTLLASEPPATVKASVLPTQRLLLPKGSFLDCTLETAIDSTLPGLVTCLTAVDTFSADGTVVLLERGTKLIGETRGEVAQGASRIFVLWNEARTPTGVVVPLASPGTDALGRSGLPGSVNRHFWDRFGAAILISMIDGAVQGAAAHQSSGSGTVVVNPNGTRDITTEILRSTINIPPTVTKQQGDRIQVLVARDLDFRSVYALHAR